MGIYTIYRARNTVTNLSYIGFTSNSLKRRKITHKHKALTKQHKSKFYNAIREYGWDSFEWTELYQAKEDCLPNNSYTLSVMENYFIQEHDSINNGYNSVDGGGLYPILIGDQNPMFGKKHNKQSKKLMKENRKKTFGQNNPMYGVKRTEEWLNKHARGKNHPMFGKHHTKESILAIKSAVTKCDYCGIETNNGNYKRWHGNNCKLKPQQ